MYNLSCIKQLTNSSRLRLGSLGKQKIVLSISALNLMLSTFIDNIMP